MFNHDDETRNVSIGGHEIAGKSMSWYHVRVDISDTQINHN